MIFSEGFNPPPMKNPVDPPGIEAGFVEVFL